MQLKAFGYPTRRARNDVFVEIANRLELCSSEQDINQLKEDYKTELNLIIEDDQHNDFYDTPIYPELKELMAERLKTIKQQENS